MDIIVQILCMLLSFIYGIFINIGFKFTKKISIKGIIKSLLLDLLFSFNVVILYIIIIYKINGGIFHIYFLLLIFLGYYVSNDIVKHLKKIIKHL